MVWPQPSQLSSLMGRRARIFSQRMGQYHASSGSLIFQSGGRVTEVVDPNRPNVCAELAQKLHAIPVEQIKHLYDGEGPQGCVATDRIVVDGAPVGYCCREKPLCRFSAVCVFWISIIVSS